jgi:hypothetical protein
MKPLPLRVQARKKERMEKEMKELRSSLEARQSEIKAKQQQVCVRAGGHEGWAVVSKCSCTHSRASSSAAAWAFACFCLALLCAGVLPPGLALAGRLASVALIGLRILGLGHACFRGYMHNVCCCVLAGIHHRGAGGETRGHAQGHQILHGAGP